MKLAEKTLRESAQLGAVSAYRAFNLRELPNFLIVRGRYEEALEAGRALTDSKYRNRAAWATRWPGTRSSGWDGPTRRAKSSKTRSESSRRFRN
jgi:hypothetical protein